MNQFEAPITTYEGFDLNQSYMTPAHLAGFRPSYVHGQDPMNPYGHDYTIGQSLSGAFSPFSPVPVGMDPLALDARHKENLASGVGDGFMTAMQYAGIPLASWYAMNKVMGTTGAGWGAAAAKRFGPMAGRMASGAASFIPKGGLGAGLGRVAGGTAAGAMNWATRNTIGRIGGGALGKSWLAGAMGRGLSSGLVAAGGFAGAIAAPLLAGQALASAADELLIDPYVSTRQGHDATRANLGLQFVGGEGSQVSGGFGISNVRATEIATKLTDLGAQDFRLETGDYNKIMDLSMRAGLMNEIGNMDADKIVDAVKGITSTVKTILDVGAATDMQEAVTIMADLRRGGLQTPRQMASAMRQLAVTSAVSGTSVNQIMDTVGRQGEVYALQQGMMGSTGMIASANAYAGYTNAFKSGLISAGQMASLGGVEGMTQNAISGTMKMLDSTYARMAMQGGTAFGNDRVSAIGKWGANFANDPLASQGDWFVNRGAYKDKALRREGSAGLTFNTLMAAAKDIGLTKSDGSIDFLHLAAVAEANGMSSEEFRSHAEAYRADSDAGARARKIGAMRANSRREMASYFDQEGYGLINAPLIGDLQVGFKQFGAMMRRNTTGMGDGIAETTSAVADWWERAQADWRGIKLPHQQSFNMGGDRVRLSSWVSREVGSSKVQIGSGKWNNFNAGLIKILNDPHNKSNPKARKLLEKIRKGEGDDEARRLALELQNESNGLLLGDVHGNSLLDSIGELQGAINNKDIKIESVDKGLSALADRSVREFDARLGILGSNIDKESRSFVMSAITGTTSEAGARDAIDARFSGREFETAYRKYKAGEKLTKREQALIDKSKGISGYIGGHGLFDKAGSAEELRVSLSGALFDKSQIDILGNIEDDQNGIDRIKRYVMSLAGGNTDLYTKMMDISGGTEGIARIADQDFGGRADTAIRDFIVQSRDNARSELKSDSKDVKINDLNDSVQDIGENLSNAFKDVDWERNISKNSAAIEELTRVIKTSSGWSQFGNKGNKVL